MIDDIEGPIDYEETAGAGPTVVLVPGSCSTGAAWRPVIAAWDGRYRCVTTSLLGYGGTAERRTAADADIAHEAAAVERVIGEAGGTVHLVGHSFGGLVALAVALRGRVPLASLSVLEAPAVALLSGDEDRSHADSFRSMSEAYFRAHRDGEETAIARMVDFYGGGGTFASWPERVRAYAVRTTAVNILDWRTAYGFALTPAALGGLGLPTLVATGTGSHPAPRRANELLASSIAEASLVVIDGAAHFMIATHGPQVAALIAAHVAATETARQRPAPTQ